jgi:hypothetical protein
MVAADVAEVAGTCGILKRWVSSINAGCVFILFLLVKS